MSDLFRNSLLMIFASASVGSVFQWNDYYFGPKPGNYLIIIAIFLISGALFSVFAKIKTRYRHLLLLLYGTCFLAYPLLIHFVLLSKTHISLISSGYLLCSSFFVVHYLEGKSIKNLCIVLGGALIVQLIFFTPEPYWINFLAVIALILGVFFGKSDLKKWALGLILICFGFYTLWLLSRSEYFELQSQVNEKIEKQIATDTATYTFTKLRDFQSLYNGNQLLYSTSDIFMFYESFVHSAFQVKPDANEVMYVGDSEFAGQEILKQPGAKLYSESDLVSKKMDIIFVDRADVAPQEFEQYKKLLDPAGLLVIKESVSRYELSGFAAKKFHVALPSLNELSWLIFTKDSLVFDDQAALHPSVKTRWYSSDTFALIAHRGKYLRAKSQLE